MARKSNKQSTASKKQQKASAAEEVQQPQEQTAVEEPIVVVACDEGKNDASSCDDVTVICGEDSSSDADGKTPTSSSSNPKARKTVIDRIDAILALIEDNAPVSVVTKQLLSLRKTLDGAQIKNMKKSRKPNMYNMFMSEQMEKLKEQDIPATEKFKMCIKLWNERKEADAAAKQ